MTNTVNIHVYKGTPKCNCDPCAVYICELDEIWITTENIIRYILELAQKYKYVTYTYLYGNEDRSELCRQTTVENGSKNEMTRCMIEGVFQLRAHRISIHLHNDNGTIKDPRHRTIQPAQEENVPRMDDMAFLKEFIKRLSHRFAPNGSSTDNIVCHNRLIYNVLSLILQYRKPDEGEDYLKEYVMCSFLFRAYRFYVSY